MPCWQASAQPRPPRAGPPVCAPPPRRSAGPCTRAAARHRRFVLRLPAWPCRRRPRLQVVDFGLSRVCSGDYLRTRTLGCAEYMPPELITEGILTKAADVYAFGVITWEIYVGRYARQLSCGLCATNVLRCAACCTAPKHLWPAGSGPLVVLPPWLATNAPHRARHPLARPCLAATPLQACVGWAEAHRGAPQGGLQYAPRLPAADTAPTQGTHLPVSVVFSLGN
jgi:hypothetical protein